MKKIICKKTGQEYTISQQESDILEKISPVLGGRQYLIPTSKFHPDVQHQQHLARRNERNLYKTTCALTGETIITNINPSQGYTIYNFKDRRGDKRDPFDYGIVFDADKSFTQQFKDMLYSMPQMSLNIGFSLENCDYCNYGLDSKNCYMSTSIARSEHCYYSYLPLKCYYDVDGHANTDCRYCYMCRYAMNCYKCQYAIYSNDCKSCKYIFDCKNCENCFACANLAHKKYCIFNKQYTKEEYIELVAELEKDAQIFQKFIDFSNLLPKRATRGFKNEGSTGDLLCYTKNCNNCFDVQSASDCVNLWTGGIETNDVANGTLTGIVSQAYNSSGLARSHSTAFIVSSDNLYQCFYCIYCKDCEYCFGCVKLTHKKYCIFNKQYTKAEYETLLPKIIEHMAETGERGEFFSPSISPFPYNDSDAYDRFPETKEQITERGGRYIEREQKHFMGDKFPIEPIEVYKNDSEKRSALLNATLTCENTKTGFRLTQQELDFYIKFDIPVPQKSYMQRYKERRNLRNLPRKLRDRKCNKCGIDIKTAYNPDSAKDGAGRPEIVWCGQCYDKELYG